MARPEGTFSVVSHQVIRCGNLLDASEFKVLLNVLSWIRQDEDECWAYIKTLAHGQRSNPSERGCGLSVRQLRRVLRNLQRKGALDIQGPTEGRSANRFRINWAFFDGHGTVADYRDTVAHDRTSGIQTTDIGDSRVLTPATVDCCHGRQVITVADDIREKNLRKRHENKACRNKPLSAGAEERGTPVDPASSLDTAGTAKPVFDPAALDRMYDAYPRKVGRAAALKSIKKALNRIAKGGYSAEQSIEFLLDRVACFAASPAGQKGQYTPHPSTWFNQDRFLDDEQEWQAKDRSGPVDTTPTFRESGKFTREF